MTGLSHNGRRPYHADQAVCSALAGLRGGLLRLRKALPRANQNDHDNQNSSSDTSHLFPSCPV